MGEAKQRLSLPTLEQYLETSVESRAADERDSFAALADLTARTMESNPRPDDPLISSHWRCVKLALLATVEGCNAEVMTHGRTADQAIVAMTKAMGLAAGYAMMSLDWIEDAPHRQLVTVYRELFVEGMKFAVDECLRREASP